jgi:hypothetical protein
MTLQYFPSAEQPSVQLAQCKMRRKGWIEHHDRNALVLLGVAQFDKELFKTATNFKSLVCSSSPVRRIH